MCTGRSLYQGKVHCVDCGGVLRPGFVYHSTLGLRVIKKKRKICAGRALLFAAADDF